MIQVLQSVTVIAKWDITPVSYHTHTHTHTFPPCLPLLFRKEDCENEIANKKQSKKIFLPIIWT